MAIATRGLRFGIGAAIVAVVSVMASATAHDQAIGYTEISWATTDNPKCIFELCPVEIIHRYTLHDAEAYLASTLEVRPDLLGNAAAQMQFARYVAENFDVWLASDSSAIPLVLVGAETDAGYVWVYQEALLPPLDRPISVTNSVLMDLLPRQTNWVNIAYDGRIRSLVLNRNMPRKTLTDAQVTGP